jgi:hypothetical protein
MKAEVAKCVWEIQGYALLNTLGEPSVAAATGAVGAVLQVDDPIHDDVLTAIQELHDHVAGVTGLPADQHPQAAQFPGGTAQLILALIRNILPFLLHHLPTPPAPPAPPPSNELPPEVATA